MKVSYGIQIHLPSEIIQLSLYYQKRDCPTGLDDQESESLYMIRVIDSKKTRL